MHLVVGMACLALRGFCILYIRLTPGFFLDSAIGENSSWSFLHPRGTRARHLPSILVDLAEYRPPLLLFALAESSESFHRHNTYNFLKKNSYNLDLPRGDSDSFHFFSNKLFNATFSVPRSSCSILYIHRLSACASAKVVCRPFLLKLCLVEEHETLIHANPLL